MPPPPDNFPPHAAINTKLAEIIKNAPSVPPWYDDWMLLGPQSSPEERLEVYQAVRNAGSLPEEAGFYLVAWQVDAITCERAETELHDLEDRLHELE